MKLETGSSPHARGAHQLLVNVCPRAGIIPAYAGSTTTRPTAARRSQDHPRIRGEHRLRLLSQRRGRGSSPHTRGALAAVAGVNALRWIIPAYAGSTHPGYLELRVARGSSPHTRGARSAHLDARPHERIIPAYAGSTFGSPVGANRRWDHPRIRGEHALGTVPCATKVGSSPHTRGALHEPDW